MFGRNRNTEPQIALHDNAYRADIVTGHSPQNVETIFPPDYKITPDRPSVVGWRIDAPKAATVIAHSVSKGAEIIRGNLTDEHMYTDSYGHRHPRELNPEVAHVTALCLDPLYTAQKSLRQLFSNDDGQFKVMWDSNLDPLQQQLAGGINDQPLVRDDLTPKEERQVNFMLAAEYSHDLLGVFSETIFVQAQQAITVAGGIEKVSDEVVGGIRGDVNRTIQRSIKEGYFGE